MTDLGKILLIFAVALCAALAMVAANSPNQAGGQTKPASSADADYCNARLRTFGLSVRAKADEPITDKNGQRDNANLCQQIVMAEAAEKTAAYAEWQFYLGIGSLVGLGVAVYAAFVAARAANAAREQVRLSRHALTDTDRAFVFPSGGSWSMQVQTQTGEPTGWLLVQDWNNSGNTPTVHLRMFAARYVDPNPIPDAFKFNLPDGIAMIPTMVAPGAAIGSAPALAFTMQEMEDICAKKTPMLHLGLGRV